MSRATSAFLAAVSRRTRPCLPPFAHTVLASALALAFLPGAAQATDRTIASGQLGVELDIREVGRDGTDADVGIFRDDDATPGRSADDVRLRNHGTLRTGSVVWRPAVSLTSQGGNGGKGDGTLPASYGGRGGDVQLENDGIVEEPADARAGLLPTALIRLSSRGGAGGDAQLSASSNGRRPPGAGGRGGDVSFSTATSITAGQSTTVVDVESRGGDSGRGGYVRLGQTLPGTTPAATAGSASAHVGQAATITTTLSGTAQQPTSALRVRSQGGDGGRGGDTNWLSSFATDGSSGGAGATAGVTLDGRVDVTGTRAVGIVVSSQGGAGGNGGNDGAILDVVPGHGGAGGSAGPAALRVGQHGSVTTHQGDAPAVFVESHGGDGGHGGQGSGAIIKVGKSGGAGGSASNAAAEASVRFDNAGSITTQGDRSVAVTLQSVGGRGGDGTPKGGSTATGGQGGRGGLVVGTNSGRISTQGESAFGLFAQSAGGTGGIGGSGNFLNFGGAGGGNAGAAGDVTIVNTGTITTEGTGAAGIVAQSVGGGAALSALQVASLTARPAGGGAGGDSSWGFFAARGGSGGSGGHGGKVSVTAGGSIETLGQDAYGVVAQSVGGGGGVAGSADAIGLGFSVAIGGNGGQGGNGGTVDIVRSTAAGHITTQGDNAVAVFAQSVGGSGGAAGSASASSIGLFSSWSLSLGGGGGGGGNGGAVNVGNHTQLATGGSNAHGVLAQSIGGGGGKGGTADAAATAISPPGLPDIGLTIAIGGTGGAGGNGDAVTIDNDAPIHTRGTQAHGLKALSVGGGGGTAGAANAATNLLGSKLNIGMSIALGGSGQGGGSGGDVTVRQLGRLDTEGQFSFGIAAASVGGGGGSGGSGVANTVVGVQQFKELDTVIQTIALADAITADFTLGGSAAKGGHGGAVKVESRDSIFTHGANATAIFAQSVGGGGGNAGGFQGGGNGDLSANMSVGGTGGGGGNGGAVAVSTLRGTDVATRLAGSHAVFAQSVGGGGGNGGGFTGAQGSEATLSVASATRLVKELGKYYKLSPDVKKSLDQSKSVKDTFAATAQYLKGFNAAILAKDTDLEARLRAANFYINLQLAQYLLKTEIEHINKELKAGQVSVPSVSVSGSVGGKGGAGGAGGGVGIVSDANVTTFGDTSYGLFAQSVGGGGGTGGSAYANGSSKLNLEFAVGGRGTQGGQGGVVTVGNAGRIVTHGGLSSGVFAQSVGGGGGVGGGSANASTISVSADVSLGGNAGKSSPGGAVTVNQQGEILTHGSQAYGVMAQSVGGGGGTFYVNQAEPLKPERFTGDVAKDVAAAQAEVVAELTKLFSAMGAPQGGAADVDNHSSILPAPSLDLKFGGRGGAGGNGGAVTVNQDGHIETRGANAFGIFGQSIGGGGGAGGNTGDSRYGKIAIGVGGFGGASGNGGAVGVTLGDQSSIQTHGDGAIGVMLQSVGGGGGYAGAWSAVSTSPEETRKNPLYLFENAMSGSSGNGGAITVAMRDSATASIRTRGTSAHGIFAQSLGGGGALVADAHGLLVERDATAGNSRVQAAGDGGAITLTTVGDIVAAGKDANAIFAQSGVQKTNGALDASRKGGNIVITHTGALRGGSGDGAAIVVDGGAANRITLKAGSTASAASGTAIVGSFGSHAIDNHGTITGRIDLVGALGGAGGTNVVNNLASGRMELAEARLGSRGSLVNEGVLAIGVPGTPAQARIEGTFTQKPEGTLLVDVAPGGAPGTLINDKLTVVGDATLGGHVLPDLVTALLPGRYPFLEATGKLDWHAADAQTRWARHVPIAWSLDGTGNTVALVPTAHFATPEGVTLSANQQAIAEHLQQAWDTGAQVQAGTFASFLSTPSAQAYANSLDSLNPENVQATAVSRLQASRAALKSVMSCPAFTGTGTTFREGECGWAQASVTRTNQRETHAIQGYRQDAATYRFGLQREIRPDWFVGVSAAYSDLRLDGADGLSRSRGDGADVAVALKHQYGNWLFAGSLAAGQGWFDNRRTVQVGRDVRYALSDSRVTTAGARLRAGYQFAGERWYVKPQVDLDVVHTRKPGYTETGAGSLDLEVSALRETTLALRPSVELGARLDLASGGWLRPYGSLGMTFMSDDAFSAEANFRGLDSHIPDFRTASHVTRVLGDAGFGVHLLTGKGYEVTAEYNAQFGRHFVSHQGSARFAVRF